MLRKTVGLLFVVALIAIAGVAGGLMYGLVLDPIRYTDVDPQDLRAEFQGDYLFLIAADYEQTGDLPIAESRLRQLGFSAQTVAGRAQLALFDQHPLAPALAKLATDLGAGSTALLDASVSPTATLPPRFTPTPTVTPSPSRTPPPTRTPRPTVTASQSATGTLVPGSNPGATPNATRPVLPPTPAPAATTRPTQAPASPVVPTALPPTVPPSPTTPPVAFTVESTRMLTMQENQGCQGLHNAFVTVVDRAGNPINGVTVALRWDDGQNTLITGHKPEFPGQVIFDLYGQYHLTVLADVGGANVQSQQTPRITSQTPNNSDLIRGGYCTDEVDCNARKNAVPEQLCYGHYSWAVTFRRTY